MYIKNEIPDVAIIGAAKSGTTFLAKLLALHPKICLGTKKEPEFFSYDDNYKKGLKYYRKNFEHSETDQLTLDASTSYSRYPQCPHSVKRLYEHSPNVKIIYLMRHPVDRAYSHYVHRYTKELYPNEPITQSFNEFVVKEPICIDSSNYRLQIEKYLEYFNRKSILFIFSHELKNNRMKVLEDICGFLDIKFDKHYFEFNKNVNVTSDYLESRIKVKISDKIKKIPGVTYLLPFIPKSVRNIIYSTIRKSTIGNRINRQFTPIPLDENERKLLVEKFKDSTNWLEEITGKDLSDWYK